MALPSSWPTGYPFRADLLAAVTSYLTESGQLEGHAPDEIGAALDTEAGNQARAIRVPTVWAAELTEALARRVARNLATRGLPLGFQVVPDAVGGVARLGGTDPEVRRLETPYRRLSVG